MEKKYKLTEETINVDGRTLYRIEALKDFSYTKKGDKGGFIENESNLSQSGDCWVYGNAKVYDNAEVFDNAKVYHNAVVCGYARVRGYAEVYGNAKVYDEAKVYGNVWVFGDAEVYGIAEVCDNARVYGRARIYGNAEIFAKTVVCGNAEIATDSDYIVFKNWWSSGRYFTWTKSNNMWIVGCFYGTGEELIDKAYKDSKLSGREYERVVKYIESILKDNNTDV